MIAACLKWVDRRPEVDPLSGTVRTDANSSGPSDADQTALEWALRIGEAWGREVVVATAGPALTEPMLRDAVAAGAGRALRADIAFKAPSEHVAAALTAALADDKIDLVVCGAWSPDRGSGSVPAYLAARMGAAQALGLITVGFATQPDGLTAERRLDGGRRERLRVTTPAVVSVESGVRLRRATLDGVLAARSAAIRVVHPRPATDVTATRLVRVGPYRPRPRALPAPASSLSARERILALTGGVVDRDPPRLVHLEPAAAADELLAQLATWGYQ